MSARTAGATKALTRTGTIVDNIKKKVLGLAAAWLSFRAVTAVGGGISEALDRIDRFAKKKVQLGLPVAELQDFSLAANLAGGDFEAIAKGLSIMQRQIGLAARTGGDLGDSLQSVIGNISILDFSKLGTSDQFKTIADGLAKITDLTQRAKIANDLFGRSGGELLPFILQGRAALEQANAQLELYNAHLSDADSTAVEAANDAWTRLRDVMDSIYNTLAVKLAPIIGAAADLFIKKWGQVATVVKQVADFISTAAGKTLIWVGATLAIATIMPAVLGAFKLLIGAYKALIGVQTISQALSGPKGWAILAVSAGIAAGGIALANNAVEKFNDELAQSIANSNDLAEQAKKLRLEGFDPLADLADTEAFDKIADNIESRAESMKQALRTPLEEFRDKLIEINELSEQLGPDFTRRAQLSARDAFASTLPQKIETSKPVQIIANVSAGQRGSQEELSRLFQVKIAEQTDVQEEILDAEQEANAKLGDILLELRKPKTNTPANLG